MTDEPYLSTVRAAPDKGKIIATALVYPTFVDGEPLPRPIHLRRQLPCDTPVQAGPRPVPR